MMGKKEVILEMELQGVKRSIKMVGIDEGKSKDD
jgi:hypothetical protein